jgi:hypothetical protein
MDPVSFGIGFTFGMGLVATPLVYFAWKVASQFR